MRAPSMKLGGEEESKEGTVMEEGSYLDEDSQSESMEETSNNTDMIYSKDQPDYFEEEEFFDDYLSLSLDQIKQNYKEELAEKQVQLVGYKIDTNTLTNVKHINFGQNEDEGQFVFKEEKKQSQFQKSSMKRVPDSSMQSEINRVEEEEDASDSQSSSQSDSQPTDSQL